MGSPRLQLLADLVAPDRGNMQIEQIPAGTLIPIPIQILHHQARFRADNDAVCHCHHRMIEWIATADRRPEIERRPGLQCGCAPAGMRAAGETPGFPIGKRENPGPVAGD